MPIEFAPPRRLLDAFMRLRARQRQSDMHNGPQLTTETIESSTTNGKYKVKGKDVDQAGQAQLRAGELAVVAWKNSNTPAVVIAHSARRIKPVGVAPTGGAGIVEVLFIAPRTLDGVIDVHFRNDQEIVPLHVREKLPSDPIGVRWGWDKKSFSVQCGNPAPVDFKFAPSLWFNSNADQIQTFWVFTLNRTPTTVLKATPPKATFKASFAPRTSTLVVARSTTDWQVLGAVGHPIIGGTIGAFVFESMVSDSLSSIGTGASNIQLGTLLGQTLGPTEIVEFFTDARGHFLLVVRARAYLGTTIVVNQNDVIIDALGAGGLSSHTVTGQTNQKVGEPGEAHVFVVDLTDGIVLFTTVDTGTIALEFSNGGGSMATFTGTIIHLGTNYTWDNIFYLGVNKWTLTDPFPPPESVANVGVMGSAGHMRRWTDAWDEARFPFIIDGSLKRNGTFITGAVTEFFNETIANTIQFNWANSTTSFPLPAPHRYAVKTLRLIPAPAKDVKAGIPFWLFLGVYRRQFINPIDDHMDYAAYVIKSTGVIVATLLDWTPMAFTDTATDAKYRALINNASKEPMENPAAWVFVEPTFDTSIPLWSITASYNAGDLVRYGGVDFAGARYVPSDMDGNTTVHDGSRADFLSGNEFHLLWTTSTAMEREAGVRHIKLSKIGLDKTGAAILPVTLDVGQNWAELLTHGLQVLNLDVMYATLPEDKTGRFFVNAWALKDGQPTLLQAQPGYPRVDHTLDLAKALRALGTLSPSVSNYQAINDVSALTPTGRTLLPSGG